MNTQACRAAAADLARHGPVVPVIVVDRIADAVPLAQALVEGGVRVLEVTLRTEAALPAIEAIARAVPQAVVGAGTVCSPAQAHAAAAAGAQFAVSPGWTPDVGAACDAAGLPLLPGVATASEVMAARERGYTLLKFFPAVPAGGAAMLKAWHGPLPDARFCPTGGIGPDNVAAFLALPNVAMCGGSWLTPADAVARADWARIRDLARAAAALRG